MTVAWFSKVAFHLPGGKKESPSTLESLLLTKKTQVYLIKKKHQSTSRYLGQCVHNKTVVSKSTKTMKKSFSHADGAYNHVDRGEYQLAEVFLAWGAHTHSSLEGYLDPALVGNEPQWSGNWVLITIIRGICLNSKCLPSYFLKC